MVNEITHHSSNDLRKQRDWVRYVLRATLNASKRISFIVESVI